MTRKAGQFVLLSGAGLYFCLEGGSLQTARILGTSSKSLLLSSNSLRVAPGYFQETHSTLLRETNSHLRVGQLPRSDCLNHVLSPTNMFPAIYKNISLKKRFFPHHSSNDIDIPPCSSVFTNTFSIVSFITALFVFLFLSSSIPVITSTFDASAY